MEKIDTFGINTFIMIRAYRLRANDKYDGPKSLDPIMSGYIL